MIFRLFVRLGPKTFQRRRTSFSSFGPFEVSRLLLFDARPLSAVLMPGTVRARVAEVMATTNARALIDLRAATRGNGGKSNNLTNLNISSIRVFIGPPAVSLI